MNDNIMSHVPVFYQCPVAPAGRVVHGDCVQVMEAMMGREQYDLIFADPPFNIGVNYLGSVDDRRKQADYDQWTFDWITSAMQLLKPGGVFFVHVPDHCVYKVLYAFRFVRPWEQIAWIIWHYRFGQCTKTSFINSKCHGLVFAKPGAPHTFNGEAVRVASDRAAKYGDRRTQESETPGMRVPFDVWGADVSTLQGDSLSGDGANWGRVTGSHSNAERRSLHENQLPEKYLERVIRAYSDPGDWILDPFLGSGTTMVVGRAVRRNVTGIEQSEEYCRSIVERVQLGSVRIPAGTSAG